MPKPEKPLNWRHKMTLSVGSNLAREYLSDFVGCVIDQRPVPPEIQRYLSDSFAAILRQESKFQGSNRSNNLGQLVVRELGIGKKVGRKLDRYRHPQAIDVQWLRRFQGLTLEAALDRVADASPGLCRDSLEKKAKQRFVRTAAQVWPPIPSRLYRDIGPLVDVHLLMENRGLTEEESCAKVASFWSMKQETLRSCLQDEAQLDPAVALIRRLQSLSAQSFCLHRVGLILGDLGRLKNQPKRHPEATRKERGWEHLRDFVRCAKEAQPIPEETLIHLSDSFKAILIQQAAFSTKRLGRFAVRELGLSGSRCLTP